MLIWNFSITVGICTITASGICPFNFSKLIGPPLGITTSSLITAGDAPNPSFSNDAGPMIPSAVNPFFVCHSLIAFSVPGPKLPSATNPNFA